MSAVEEIRPSKATVGSHVGLCCIRRVAKQPNVIVVRIDASASASNGQYNCQHDRMIQSEGPVTST